MSRGRNDKTNKVAESKLVLDDEVLLTTFSFDLILAQKQPPEVLLEISQNSQENTCARVSFLVNLQASGVQLYHTFYTEHLWAQLIHSLYICGMPHKKINPPLTAK